MAGEALDVVVRYLRRVAGADGIGALSDANLLARFVQTRDEAAFEVLVWRHGALVLGLCRKLLRHEQDAEDAFQAVFLTLSRKPPSLVKHASLGGWLHRITCRIAIRLRAQSQRRNARERVDLDVVAGSAASPDTAATEQSELWGLVIEELQRLPDRYRQPVISCYLQGKTHVEAARELNQPAGSMSRVLDRGCQMLNARLTRRGVRLSAAVLCTVLADRSWAALPAGLVQPLVTTAIKFSRGLPVEGPAVSLARGLIQGMFLSKVKIAVGVLVALCALAGGAVGLARQGQFQLALQAERAGSAGGMAQQSEAKKPNVDAFGDPLPPGAVSRLGTVRWRQGSPITCLAISTDGGLVASAGKEGGIRLWEASTGKQLGVLHKDGIAGANSLAFSGNGKLLASTSSNEGAGAHLWALETREWLRDCEFQKGQVPSGVAFSADGSTLAVSSQGVFSLNLYDTGTGKLTRPLVGHTSGTHGVAFSTDGRTLASAGADGMVRLWDPATGKETASLKHSEGVLAVALDANGKLLASETTRAVYLWDLTNGKEIWRKEDSGFRKALAFSPDGKLLASEGTFPAQGIVWEVPSGKQIWRLTWDQVNCQVNGVAFAPDGRTLFAGSAEGAIRLWDLREKRELSGARGPRGSVSYLAFGADEKTLITSSNASNEPRLWDAVAGKEVRRFPVRDWNDILLASSPNGKWLLTESNNPEPSSNPTLFDTATGQKVRQLVGHKKQQNYDLVLSAAFTSDSKIIATGGHDGTVRLWEAANGNTLQVLAGHESLVTFVSFVGDDKKLVSVTDQGMTRLWDLTTGQERHWPGPKYISGFALSPDGKYLAMKFLVGKGYAIRLYDVATGKVIRSIDGLEGMHKSLAFSPDGKTLAYGHVLLEPGVGREHVICLWETATGRERGRLKGHQGFVSDLAFSPNGKFLASGSEDSTTLIWDLAAAVSAGRPKSSQLSREQIESLWADLASADATKAYRAIWALAGDPEHTVPFLERVLQPAPPADPALIKRLLGDLDNNRSVTREKAMAELEKLGETALPLLRQALANEVSAEVRRRVQQLIGKSETIEFPDRLRLLRAIEVLENMATPEAGKLLTSLAGGNPEARLTREAAAAGARIRARHLQDREDKLSGG